MPATSVTRSYTSVVALTLDKVKKVLEDQISKNNKLFFFYKKSGNWSGVASGSGLGDRLRVPLMYELAPADSYSRFGQIDTTPTDGITDAFYDWRQAAAVIAISGMDKAQNRGSEGFISILKSRTKQAVLGLEDLFSKALLQGQGSVDGTSLATARLSPLNGSQFIDPLGLLIKFDPTSSTTIGDINQSTNTWWRNQFTDSSASSFVAFLKELRVLHQKCSRGGGGSKASPDFHVCEEQTYALYETALASNHHNPDYKMADIPFQNIQFKGKPTIWDENVPDVKTGTTSITKGTWYMCNSEFMGVTFDEEHNFSTEDFVRPENQDAEAAQVLWYGTHWTNNRRKLGVLGDVDLTITS